VEAVPAVDRQHDRPAHREVDPVTGLRRLCGAGLGLAIVFVVWSSLVPWHFIVPTYLVDTVVGAFRHSLRVGIESKTDFAGNVLLFLPIGLFGAGVAAAGRYGTRRLAGLLLLVAGSVVLSVSIESLQALVPGRTTAVSDVAAQTIGMLGGLAVWLALEAEIERWAARTLWGRPRLSDVVLAVYAAGWVVARLTPWDIAADVHTLAYKARTGLIVVDPMRSPVLRAGLSGALVADLALAVPLGAFACLAGVRGGGRRGVLWALVVALFVTCGTGLAQVFVASRRADAVEILATVLGAVAGVLLTAAVVRRGDRAAGAWRRVALPAVGLAAALALYAGVCWFPFDFAYSHELVRSRLPMLDGVPFAHVLFHGSPRMFFDAGVAFVAAIPIGTLLGWRWPLASLAYPRFATGTAAVFAVAFFSAVEAGRLLLPSRPPDDTHILLALCGLWAGFRAVQPVRRAEPRIAELGRVDGGS
jgi:VanZ family protein